MCASGVAPVACPRPKRRTGSEAIGLKKPFGFPEGFLLPALRQHCFGEVLSEAVGSKREVGRVAAHRINLSW